MMKTRVIKVLMWRIISILITMIVMIFATGDIKSATGLTLMLHFILTVANYGFETFWEDRFGFGE